MFNEPYILLIEDNPDEVRIIKDYCKQKSAKTRFIDFNNGEEVLKYLVDIKSNSFESHPHLIILDLRLPTIGGIDLIKDLKSKGPLTCIPLVVFTASDAEKDIMDAYKLYANSFIVKPQDPDQYRKSLEEIWDFWFNTVKLPNMTRVA